MAVRDGLSPQPGLADGGHPLPFFRMVHLIDVVQSEQIFRGSKPENIRRLLIGEAWFSGMNDDPLQGIFHDIPEPAFAFPHLLLGMHKVGEILVKA